MKKTILAVMLFALVFGSFGCKEKSKLNEISANLTNYEISLDYDETSHSVKASERVEYVNNTNAILKCVEFHLYPQFFKEEGAKQVVAQTHLNQAYPNGMSYSQFDVTRVRVAGADRQIRFVGECNGVLAVDLFSSLMPSEKVEIEIDFGFTLPNCCHRFGYGEHTINLGNSYPIVCVYENGAFDESGYHPNGDPFYSDVANYVVDITASSNFIVAASGEKTAEKRSNGKTTSSFYGKCIRDFALVLSKDFKVESAEEDFDDENHSSSLKAGMDAVKTFSDLFLKYPYASFSIVQTDFVYGGMEYPNLVMISAEVNDPDDYKNVIVHETAHQWWYGIVGNDEWEFPWLDESLAEYSSMLFYDHNDGYNFTRTQMLEASHANYSLFISVYNDVLGDIDTSMRAIDKYSTEPEYTYCTYVKGAMMWDGLRNLIGEKKFIACLKTYCEQNQFAISSPEKLITAFEGESKMQLRNFFNSWIDGKVVIR